MFRISYILVMIVSFALSEAVTYTGVRSSAARQVVQVPSVWHCENSQVLAVVEAALLAGFETTDQINEYVETQLQNYFNHDGGRWFVSSIKVTALAEYIDDLAKNLQTFCSVYDDMTQTQILIVKTTK